MNERGIIYLCLGLKHASLLAVSVFTLRKHWQGPVAIFADEQARAIVSSIADAAGNAQAIIIDPLRQRRNTGYATKPALPKLSPFEFTIQVDADTTWVGSPEPLFDTLTPQLCVVTQFANWISTGPKISGRIKQWEKADPERVKRSLEKSWPALNTGVVAYGCESPVAREAWLEETMKQPTIFMADELSFQILVPDYADRPDLLRIDEDRFNCSPRFGVHKADAVVWHFHGHGKIARLPQYQEKWLPAFHEAWVANFSNMQEWVPQVAKPWLRPFIEEVKRGS